MQKLHHRRHADRVVTRTIAADCIVRKNRERRPHTFPARRAQVLAEIVDHLHVRTRLALEFEFDLDHFIGDDAEDAPRRNPRLFIERNCVGWRSHDDRV